MADNQTENKNKDAVTEEASLLDQIMAETRIKPEDEGYDTAKKGVQAFISDLLEPSKAGAKVEQKVVDNMIAEIDLKISKQVDAIIHNKQFQNIESAWRGLKMVVDRTDFRENIKIELLSVTKDELSEDFEDSPEVTK